MTLAGDERATAPEGDADDAIQQGAQHPSVIASTPDGLRLQRLIEATEGFGDDAEAYFEEALAEAREKSAGVLVEIARALGGCHDDDYPMRWSLTYSAAAIGGKKALPLLANVALTPIPDELSPDPHSFSSVEEETVIRTTAVDGISDLARDGNDKAVDVLFDLLASPSFSIRRSAVTGLKASPRGEELVDRIAECLPEDERFLLDLKRVDVRKVEQVGEPREHLSEKGLAESKPVPPVFGDGAEVDIEVGPTQTRRAIRADRDIDHDEDDYDEEKGE